MPWSKVNAIMPTPSVTTPRIFAVPTGSPIKARLTISVMSGAVPRASG